MVQSAGFDGDIGEGGIQDFGQVFGHRADFVHRPVNFNCGNLRWRQANPAHRIAIVEYEASGQSLPRLRRWPEWAE